MVAPDILPILIAIIILILYNSAITTIFIYQRWRLASLKTNRTGLILIMIYVLALFAFFLLHYIFKLGFEVWAFIYGLALTVITVGDKIARKKKM